jgi:hypothetical protein
MPKKLFYRNARDAILALSASRKYIDEDTADAAVGVEEKVTAKRKRLIGLLWGRVWKSGFYVVLESDLTGRRVGGPCTFLPRETTRNERSFEKER